MTITNHKARILVAEDSATQAEQLHYILTSADYHVTVARSGEEALEVLATQAFDLVISDIVMPGISGYELCQQAKTLWPEMPVVLLTTRRDPMDIFRGLECGADNFHTKPYDNKNLLERIHFILYNRALKNQGKLKLGLQVAFFGKIFNINSEKEQILDLLISAFEDTVNANRALERHKEELAAANRTIEEYARRLEGKVKSSEQRYSAIVNGINEGIITFDQAGLIDSVNPAAEAIFGYHHNALGGQPITRLLAADSHAGFNASLQYCGSHENHNQPGYLRGLHQDGSTFPISLLLNRIAIGENQTFVAMVRDLTVEHKAEEQLRHAQKMESIGHLSGGIAHDFNNLLTIVLGNSEQLVAELAQQPRSQMMARMSLKAAEKGAELTRRLLAFARRQPLNPQVIDVNNLVSGMTGLLTRSLGSDIEIKVVPSPDLWPALVDPGQLENALLNLSINARDAMPGGGFLTIETSNTHLDEDYVRHNPDALVGDYILLAVSDTGTGIPPDLLTRVFDPFFTTKEMGKGSGLGLSMVYGFIKQSSGHVKIYSEQSVGTSMKLYLPRALHLGVKEPVVPVSPINELSGNEKILLVEDDPLVREFVLSLVSSLGYNVISAGNGPEALAILDHHTDFDLLFTDIVMPGGINGRELAEQMRKRYPRIPVLFTSGYTESAALRGYKLGGSEVMVSKPYRRNDLARKIREALSLKCNLP